MIKKYKTSLILSSVAILLPMVFGLIFWNKLPATMPIHWGLDGTADGFGSKAVTVFVLPLVLLGLHWLCVLFTSLDKKNKDQSGKVMNMVLWITPVLSCFMSAFMYAVALGREFNIGMLTGGLIGLLFVILGNYMPKCKQNSTIGIKIKWTLSNEENWNATHRLAGKIWVVCGLLLILLGVLLPERSAVWGLLACILPAVAIPSIYSYTYYKKQVKNGTAPEKAENPIKNNKIVFICTTVFCVLTLAFVAVLCFSGDVAVVFAENEFTVQADYYSDLTVDYEAVERIEYRETFDKGNRVNGFGSPRLSMGTFKNDEFGLYTIYAYTNCPSAVVMYSENGTLVLCGADDAATKAIFDTLEERVQ